MFPFFFIPVNYTQPLAYCNFSVVPFFVMHPVHVDLISDALPFGGLWYAGPIHYQLRLQHPSWLATRVTLQFCVKPSMFTASSKLLVHHQPYRFALVG